jgi:hypothetical protein
MTIEDQHFGLPNCWFKARLEIRVSSGSCYLRLSVVAAASLLLSSFQ